MEEKIILRRTADVINDRYIYLEFDKKTNWLQKKLKRPQTVVFAVKRACLGTLINFSAITLALIPPENKNFQQIISAISSNGELMIRCLAILIEDTDQEPSKKLLKFLRTIDASDSKAALVFLLEHSRVQDFMSTTILLSGMSLLKTEEMIAFEKTIGKQST